MSKTAKSLKGITRNARYDTPDEILGNDLPEKLVQRLARKHAERARDVARASMRKLHQRTREQVLSDRSACLFGQDAMWSRKLRGTL